MAHPVLLSLANQSGIVRLIALIPTRKFSLLVCPTACAHAKSHRILIAALGLPSDGRLLQHPALVSRSHYASSGHRRVQRSIILEAEVVPYNEGQREGMRGPGIEEFWWLGAAGVTAERDASGL